MKWYVSLVVVIIGSKWMETAADTTSFTPYNCEGLKAQDDLDLIGVSY